jgi:hypothetical protein
MLAGKVTPLFLCHFESVEELNYEWVETVELLEIKK